MSDARNYAPTFMYLTVIAWIYVVLMMSIAEATSTNGTLLGAFMTFLLYGALPLSIVMYLMGTPSRRKALKARKQELEASNQPNAGGHASSPQNDGLAGPTGDAAPMPAAAMREKS